MKGKNKEIIIAHPLDKLWMLPNGTWVSDLVLFCFSTITFHEKSFTLQKSAGDMNALAEVALLSKSENLGTRKAKVI